MQISLMLLQMLLLMKAFLILRKMVKDLPLSLKLVLLKSNMVIWLLYFSNHLWFLKHLPQVLLAPIILLLLFHLSPQDMKSQKMIGLGNICDGLYKLNTASCNQKSFVSSSTSLCAPVSLNSCNSVCSSVAISFIPSNAI
ncbi:hypothetical protein MtrunA17_Chr2g0311111 [Medicago truncatula]|uniref:Transmembrane protein n=1 Tax=Medicago truncatula TaxID=3880 RepID=I3SV01_MEDTR|nr:uncharacterized protein LOC112419045 [Medicago truncatula]AFK44093.1 unknown [Medicago truncatula]RHN74502.1 hypothetical protein MtrunA17_Chr2g0311111 [Medicago truncatula]